jgi:hypothetical protein
MRPQDPILDELHAIREALAKASNDDLQQIAEAAKDRQRNSGHEIVRLPPKRVDRAQKAS